MKQALFNVMKRRDQEWDGRCFTSVKINSLLYSETVAAKVALIGGYVTIVRNFVAFFEDFTTFCAL